MSGRPQRQPQLEVFYHRFLEDGSSPDFIAAVAATYNRATLGRLALSPRRETRRAAILALGIVGEFEENSILGRALCDEDRGVRRLAEHGIQELWLRDGDPSQREQLRRLTRLNQRGRFEEATSLADHLIAEAPRIAEAWNQRAVAWFQREDYVRSLRDCRQTLRLNPYQFGALIGVAHCQLEMYDPLGALASLRRALAIHPDLESVRAQARYLERATRGEA